MDSELISVKREKKKWMQRFFLSRETRKRLWLALGSFEVSVFHFVKSFLYFQNHCKMSAKSARYFLSTGAVFIHKHCADKTGIAQCFYSN